MPHRCVSRCTPCAIPPPNEQPRCELAAMGARRYGERSAECPVCFRFGRRYVRNRCQADTRHDRCRVPPNRLRRDYPANDTLSLRVHQSRLLMVFAVLGPSSASTSSTALDFTNASTLRSSRLDATMYVPPDLFVDTSAILPGIQRVAAQNVLGPGRSIPSGPKRFLAPLFEGEPSARRTGGDPRR